MRPHFVLTSSVGYRGRHIWLAVLRIKCQPALHSVTQLLPSATDFVFLSTKAIGNLLPTSWLAGTRYYLIEHNAQELLTVFSIFDSLGSHSCNLYRVLSFETLHVTDLGTTRQFCDFTNTVLQLQCTLHHSHLISTDKDSYDSLPNFACLSSLAPSSVKIHFDAGFQSLADCMGEAATWPSMVWRVTPNYVL